MRRLGTLAAAALLATVPVLPGAGQTGDGYRVVNTFPHDSEAFTQGLEFKGDRLFETTGLNGESSLRRVRLQTGQVIRRFDLADEHFGEGMTIFGDRLYWITWRSEKVFFFDPATFERRGRDTYQGEGWGLTHNRRSLVMSNGTSRIVFRNPKTFEIRRRITVTDGAEEIDRLNELEWIKGEIFANVWQSERIARIDPDDGEVVGWIDIGALMEREQAEGDPDVANGIAYIKKSDRLFVTGKEWAHIYEIELTN